MYNYSTHSNQHMYFAINTQRSSTFKGHLAGLSLQRQEVWYSSPQPETSLSGEDPRLRWSKPLQEPCRVEEVNHDWA